MFCYFCCGNVRDGKCWRLTAYFQPTNPQRSTPLALPNEREMMSGRQHDGSRRWRGGALCLHPLRGEQGGDEHHMKTAALKDAHDSIEMVSAFGITHLDPTICSHGRWLVTGFVCKMVCGDRWWLEGNCGVADRSAAKRVRAPPGDLL